MSAAAVVLLSGGLDSSTALAWATRRQGWRCHTIAFDYGQRHRIELAAAVRVADALGSLSHRVIKVDLAAIGGSALTADIAVPKDALGEATIPITYVPARNLIFLSLAAALAETVGATRLVIGANVVDYSGYPDCRPEFLDAFARAATLGTKMGVEGGRLVVEAPLVRMTKPEIICLGLELGFDYSLTHSCYDPDAAGAACGRCDSCLIRQRAFADLGLADPVRYRVL